MDGITLRAVAVSLEKDLLDARIEKIYQPEKDELLLHLRGGQRLLLSASASHARVQLTTTSRNNPQTPPMFCMLLRKYLIGARITGIDQPHFERVLVIHFLSRDEMGYEAMFSLIIEVMGKYSNIIFVREDTNIIVDAIKHITPSITSVRLVMPGLSYEEPPAQNKRNPLLDDPTDIMQTLRGQKGELKQLILQNWSGFAPAFAQEASLRCQWNQPWEIATTQEQTQIANRLSTFFDMLRNARFSPTLILNEFQEPIACFPFVSVQYDPAFQCPYDDINQALDAFYSLRDNITRMKQKGSSLHRIIQQQIDRAQKKLSIQQDILLQSEKMQRDRLYGELLIAHAHEINRGDISIAVPNYYEESMPMVTIPLDSTLSGMDNAQRYYKRYRKAKSAFAMADDQIQRIQKDLDYLEGQLDNLSKCTQENELIQIREELIDQGYLRPDRNEKNRKKIKISSTKPMHFLSSDGTDIYIGKNNTQNDELTLRFADPEDMWLHTKNIPGSHVIIKHSSPSDTTLNEAAHLAAYYSKSKHGTHVPVDYTLRKFIKKPNGSAPGFVIYSTNKTAYITPDEKLIKSLTQL